MIVLTLIAAVVAIFSIWMWRITLREKLFELNPVAGGDDLPELVSIIVPMRNEEMNVDRCLAGLRSQSCDHLETIVVDDCSTDRTPERLAVWKNKWPELRTLRLDRDEERWTGKSYALHRGVQMAAGTALIFVDADVALAPGAISRIVNTAWERRWPVLSVVGRPDSATLWEKAIVTALLARVMFFRIMRPDSVLLGAFIYIKRSLYESIGGYEPVRKSIQEDTALARALAEYGVPPRTMWWPDAYGLRMYSTWREAWDGLTRLFSGIGDYKPRRVGRMALFIGISAILPTLGIISLLTSVSIYDPWSVAFLVSCGLAAVFGIALYAQLIVGIGISPAMALTKPFSDYIFFLAALHATAKAVAGGSVTWRGRQYSKSFVREPNLDVYKPQESPAPQQARIRGGRGLSLILPMPEEAPAGTMEPILQLAGRHPEVELVVVTERPLDLGAARAANIKVFQCSPTTAFAMPRLGFLDSEGDVIAFLGFQGKYSSNWIQAVIDAFESSNTGILVGNTQYEGDPLLAHAGWMRDWAQLHGLGIPVPRISTGNFAARREVLNRYEFGHDLHGRCAALVLATQAAMDGVVISHAPEMVCWLKNPYEDRGAAMQSLRADYQLARELYNLGIAQIDRPPFASQMFARVLPLVVARRLRKLIAKNASRLCSEKGLSEQDRSDVLDRLKKLVALDGRAAFWEVVSAGNPTHVQQSLVRGDSDSANDWENVVRRGTYRVLSFYGREYYGNR